MTILYYFYSNDQGENKPQNSPTLESATFDYPLAFILTWMVQLAADWVQFTGQKAEGPTTGCLNTVLETFNKYYLTKAKVEEVEHQQENRGDGGNLL